MKIIIEKNRTGFYQWDTGQKLIIEGAENCGEVHFCRTGDAVALTCQIREEEGKRVADVPNSLLQIDIPLTAYLFYRAENGAETRMAKSFQVLRRPKPADYVYTEEEQLSYTALDKRIKELEDADEVDPEVIAESVEQYMAKNPVTPDGIGAIPAEKLPEAVNDALAQAKASGEFKGEKGDTGPQGSKGEKGDQGEPGPAGPAGAKGDKGDPGEKGEQGIQGIQGEKGADGAKGDKGDKGDPGEKGADGAKGDKGDPGAAGENGKDGADGVSATHSWNGTVLTITSASGTSSADLKGEKGDKGDKGDTGATGANGTNGTNGKDGTSVTVSSVTESTENGGTNVVTFSDGKKVNIKNGINGTNGKDGADGKTPVKGVDYFDGSDGKDGYTPQKGVDYFDGVDGKDGENGKDGLDATPVTPLFANSVDECTDTSKLYVLPDGFIYACQYVEATGPSYTNLAGTITYDKRLSSSGKVSSSAMPGACYSGFIPVKQGQVVRIKGLDIYTDLSSSAYSYVCFYTGASESNVVSSTTYITPKTYKNDFNGVENSVSGGVVTWTAFEYAGGSQHSLASSITHIRISGKYFADKEIIVTVDEEITEGGSAGGYTWVNTGHAFVPADYEAEILALQKNKADKTAIPVKLPNPNALTIDGVKYDGSAAVNIETQSGGNILYGKKWVACGDSFTENGYNASDGFDESVYIYQDGRFAGRYKVYPNIIGLRNNMNIVNLATGGQTMAASSNSFMTRYTNIDADADYITIMLGINDKIQGIPVGTLEDTVNTTFCGAFNIAMEHILENHPFAHIGIMVSHGTNEEIMEATRGIAERWGVPYLDYGSPQVPLMNRYTGRNVCAKAQQIREKNFCVISDGTTATNGHPNTAAHEYESTFIEAWLRTL